MDNIFEAIRSGEGVLAFIVLALVAGFLMIAQGNKFFGLVVAYSRLDKSRDRDARRKQTPRVAGAFIPAEKHHCS